MIALNLGCGPLRLDGEIGVDAHPTEACDVRGDVLALPFRDGCADRVRLDHVLEHQEYRSTVRVLREARRVLRPGGMVTIGVPDLEMTCVAYVEAAGDPMERALLLRSLYGSQVHAGEYHKAGWSPETLRDVLDAVGFADVAVGPDPEREEGYCLRATAAKPADGASSTTTRSGGEEGVNP